MLETIGLVLLGLSALVYVVIKFKLLDWRYQSRPAYVSEIMLDDLRHHARKPEYAFLMIHKQASAILVEAEKFVYISILFQATEELGEGIIRYRSEVDGHMWCLTADIADSTQIGKILDAAMRDIDALVRIYYAHIPLSEPTSTRD